MKNIEELIGKKVKGFKFESNENLVYYRYMGKYIGKIGYVTKKYDDGTCRIDFGGNYFFYPIDQIEDHLVEEETKPHSFCETPEEKCTMNYCDDNGCQNRKRVLVEENEIPTLTDGFMMLVSDDNENWEKIKVFGKKDNFFYGWGYLSEYGAVKWKYAKPLEPTKEEQLTAILGSSDKVAEIMELFKNE